MANYLVATVHRRNLPALERWLRQYGDPAERHLESLGDHWSRLVVSNHLRESLTPTGWFRGNVVTEETIYFRRSPTRALERAGGTFVDMHFTPKGARIRRDHMGRFALLATRAPGFAAASDSLLLLASLRRALGFKNSRNLHALLAYGMPGFDTTQAIASDTFITEIQAIAAFFGVELRRDRIVLHDSGLKALTQPVDDPAQALREGAAQIASVIGGLEGVPGRKLQLALSGGYDSRAVLAASLAAGIRPHILSTNSSTSHSADFAAALGVVQEYGLSLNDIPAHTAPEPHRDRRLAYFGSFRAGTYYRIGATKTAPLTEGVMHMDGLGSYLESDRFGRVTWERFAKGYIRNSIFNPKHPVCDEFIAIGMRGLREKGYAVNDPDGETWLGIGYCTGTHGAIEHIARDPNVFAPLGQPRMLQAGCTYLGKVTSLDLILLYEPQLAVMPFDQPGRGYSKLKAERRLAELGGQLRIDPDRRHALVGSAEDQRIGPSELSLRVAEAAGFVGGDEGVTIGWYYGGNRDLLRRGILKRVYDEVHGNGLWMMRERKVPLAASGNSLAKSASLQLLHLTR